MVVVALVGFGCVSNGTWSLLPPLTSPQHNRDPDLTRPLVEPPASPYEEQGGRPSDPKAG